MIAKHLQVVKLELEAALKQEQWDELEDLFEECWKYGGPTHYDTLADLVLIIYSSMAEDSVDAKYQTSECARHSLCRFMTLIAMQKFFPHCRESSMRAERAPALTWARCLDGSDVCSSLLSHTTRRSV